MKNVKFRAWDKEEQSMIVDEQSFIPAMVTNKGVFKLNPRHEEDDWILLPLERFELMQSTGVVDKNGTEIFEGDIIGGMGWSDKSEIYVLEYDGLEFNLEAPDGFDYEFYNGDYPNGDYVGAFQLEGDGIVLGNIYENKDLLK